MRGPDGPWQRGLTSERRNDWREEQTTDEELANRGSEVCGLSTEEAILPAQRQPPHEEPAKRLGVSSGNVHL